MVVMSMVDLRELDTFREGITFFEAGHSVWGFKIIVEDMFQIVV